MPLHRLLHRPLICPLILAVGLSAAHAQTAWDETVSGDFSNAGLSPTSVSLQLGSNLVKGATGRIAGVVDRDYFSFTLPAGWQLDTLTVLPGTGFAGSSPVGFMGVQAGPQVTVNPTGGSATGLLGWLHYSENDVGTDILGLLGIGFGASGFVTPLPAGTYSFWVQDTATGSAPYNFDFSVSAVPEASSAGLLLAGLAAGMGWRSLRLPRRRLHNNKPTCPPV